jgi:hypothetical protein
MGGCSRTFLGDPKSERLIGGFHAEAFNRVGRARLSQLNTNLFISGSKFLAPTSLLTL